MNSESPPQLTLKAGFFLGLNLFVSTSGLPVATTTIANLSHPLRMAWSNHFLTLNQNINVVVFDLAIQLYNFVIVRHDPIPQFIDSIPQFMELFHEALSCAI